MTAIKSLIRWVDRNLLFRVPCSIWISLTRSNPLSLVPAILLTRGQQAISQRKLKTAEKLLRRATSMQLLICKEIAPQDLLYFFSFAHQHITDKGYARISYRSLQIPSLYCIYRYLIYFGEFRDACDVRNELTKKAAEKIRSEPAEQEPYFFVFALEQMGLSETCNALMKAKHKTPQQKRIVRSIKEIALHSHATPSKKQPLAYVIGPNANERDLPDISEKREMVVRLNKSPDLTQPSSQTEGYCDAVYLNRDFSKKIVDNKIRLLSRKTAFLLRDSDADLVELVKKKTNDRVNLYRRPNTLLINGHANMVPAATYDLVLKNYFVKILGTDFFTSKQLYNSPHHSSQKEEKETHLILRDHDPLSNFAFLKTLYNEGLVTADGLTSTLNDLSLEEYAGKLQERFGKLQIE